MTDYEYIREKIPADELLCQLMEECGELSAAANHLRRARNEVNPTPKDLMDATVEFEEEIADVLTVLIETGAARAVSTVEAAALIENTPGDSADELAEDIRLFAPDEKDLPKSDGADRDRQPYDPYDLWKTVWRLAGGVGVDWRELSLRQLWYMADGAQRAAWSIASAVMALIANCNRDSKSHPRPFTPDEFSP